MFDKEAIQEMMKADAIRAANGHLPSQTHTLLAPADFKLVSFSSNMPHRQRARGVMRTSAVGDFGAYVATHAEEGAAVFVDPEEMVASGVLNLGCADRPGHADNVALLKLDATAEYLALRDHASGNPLSQKSLSEFFEDWQDHIRFVDGEGLDISPSRAIAAIRKITIETAKKVESEERSLGASKSAFESVQATSTEAIPAYIHFVCTPYHGLTARTFVARLSIITGGNAPTMTLRIAKQEQHRQEMARELVQLVAEFVSSEVQRLGASNIPVLVGEYKPTA